MSTARPEGWSCRVLVDDDGTPRLRPPKRDITTRMLLLHTAGFGSAMDPAISVSATPTDR